MSELDQPAKTMLHIDQPATGRVRMTSAERSDGGPVVVGDDGLVEFLRARLDEDEAEAKACPEVGWFAAEWDEGAVYLSGTGASALLRGRSFSVARHVARHDPARVLAEVEAKRQIVSEVTGRYLESWTAVTHILACLALPYADHPDYNPTWRP